MGYAEVARLHFGPPERAWACRSQQAHRPVRPGRIARYSRRDYSLQILSNPRPVLYVRTVHSQGAQARQTRSIRLCSSSGLYRSDDVHSRVVDCARKSWVVVTRVGHVGRHVDQGGARQLVSSLGGIYCDSGSSVRGGGSASIREVWQGMGELGKEGEVQARAIRLLGIFTTIPRECLNLFDIQIWFVIFCDLNKFTQTTARTCPKFFVDISAHSSYDDDLSPHRGTPSIIGNI